MEFFCRRRRTTVSALVICYVNTKKIDSAYLEPHSIDRWADPDVYLFLLKSSMNFHTNDVLREQKVEALWQAFLSAKLRGQNIILHFLAVFDVH